MPLTETIQWHEASEPVPNRGWVVIQIHEDQFQLLLVQYSFTAFGKCWAEIKGPQAAEATKNPSFPAISDLLADDQVEHDNQRRFELVKEIIRGNVLGVWKNSHNHAMEAVELADAILTELKKRESVK